MQDSLIGHTIGGYCLQALIARGGSGRVFQASHAATGRVVALKLIDLPTHDAAETAAFRAAFETEARVVASLEDLHILPIFDYGIEARAPDTPQHGEFAYLVTRLMRGGTLGNLIDGQPLPMRRVAVLFGQIARALQTAHRAGIIHCDLKPSNILLDEHENAYLADFGMARMLQSAPSAPGYIAGTPAYLAPEQLHGSAADQRTDVYALGLILYEMLTGKPTFSVQGGDAASLLVKHLTTPPIPPSQYNPSIAPALEQVVLRALEKSPHARFPTIAAMQHAFERADADSRRRTRGKLRHVRTWAVRAAVLAALLLAAVGILNRAHSRSAYAFHAESAILAGVSGAPADTQPSDEQQARAREALGETGFIGYIACNTDTPPSLATIDEMRAEAQRMGVQFRVYDGARDIYTQITAVEIARSQGARALIICALDAVLIENTVEAAEAAGLPAVIISDQAIACAVNVQTDNYGMGVQIGEIAARYALRHFSDQPPVLVRVFLPRYPDWFAGMQRSHGMLDGFNRVVGVNYPVEFIAGDINGDSAAVQSQVAALLEYETAFDIVLAYNDSVTEGTIRALTAAGQPAAVFAVGTPVSLPFVERGDYLRALMIIRRDVSALSAFQASVKLLGGGALPQTILVPYGDLRLAETS